MSVVFLDSRQLEPRTHIERIAPIELGSHFLFLYLEYARLYLLVLDPTAQISLKLELVLMHNIHKVVKFVHGVKFTIRH